MKAWREASLDLPLVQKSTHLHIEIEPEPARSSVQRAKRVAAPSFFDDESI